MKKTMLWSVLFTCFISNQVQAAISPEPVQTQTTTSTSTPGTNVHTIETTVTNPATPNDPSVPATNVQPAVGDVKVIKQTTTVQIQANPAINCEYKIPPQTKIVDQALVLKWSETAVTQAFDFDAVNLDKQIQKLKACFTEQGWVGFNSALQKSGNLEAIKTQSLNVSSQIDGAAQVTETNGAQWKVNLPLQVVYQNNKEKVTQLLSIDVTIGRKISGDLGIIQMIANPRTPNPNVQTQTPVPVDRNGAVIVRPAPVPVDNSGAVIVQPDPVSVDNNGAVIVRPAPVP